MKLIDKDAVVAEIRGKINSAEAYLKYHPDDRNRLVYSYKHQILTMCELLSFINTLEVKEVDLEEELKNLIGNVGQCDRKLAKHFFELGLKVSSSITATDVGMAAQIIINLKRVEKDYHINLIKEIEWLRKMVKKGGDE